MVRRLNGRYRLSTRPCRAFGVAGSYLARLLYSIGCLEETDRLTRRRRRQRRRLGGEHEEERAAGIMNTNEGIHPGFCQTDGNDGKNENSLEHSNIKNVVLL